MDFHVLVRAIIPTVSEDFAKFKQAWNLECWRKSVGFIVGGVVCFAGLSGLRVALTSLTHHS
jgi:hypothetical protein